MPDFFSRYFFSSFHLNEHCEQPFTFGIIKVHQILILSNTFFFFFFFFSFFFFFLFSLKIFSIFYSSWSKAIANSVCNCLLRSSIAYLCYWQVNEINRGRTAIMKHYSLRGSSDRYHKIWIWEAAWATAATLSFLDSIKIDQFWKKIVNEVMGANNSIVQLRNEARNVWSEEMFEKMSYTWYLSVPVFHSWIFMVQAFSKLQKRWKTLQSRQK